jgi:tetratricopeptide (TPR) repeat protein
MQIKVLYIFLLTFFLIAFVGCTKDERQLKSAEPYYETAQQNLKVKNLKESEKYLEEAIKIYPEYIEAHILRQFLMSKRVSEDILVSEYEKFLKDDSKSPARHFLYGRLLTDMDDQKLEYERAIDLEPKFGWGYFGLGWLEYKKKRYGAAKELFSKAVSLDSENAFFQNNLGGAAYYLGQHDEAIQAFEAARTLNTHYARPYSNLATIYYERGNFDTSIRMLDHFLNLYPIAPDYQILSQKLVQMRGK